MTDVHKPSGLSGQNAVVAAVFLLILTAYLISIPGVWFIHSDSAHYLGLGRSLAAGDGYTFNRAPYGKYPPGFPLMIAAVHVAVGESVWAVQAIGALCGVGALFVTYLVVRARDGQLAGLAVAVLTGACSWFWAHSCVYVLSGIPHAFIALIALWLTEREIHSADLSLWRWLLAALCAAAAVMMHMSAAALGAALAAGALFAKGQSRPVRTRLVGGALVFVLCTGAAAGWMAYGRRGDLGSDYSKLASAEPMKILKDP